MIGHSGCRNLNTLAELNLLQRTLIEKAGYENGFENSTLAEDSKVCLSSARHVAMAIIDGLDSSGKLSVSLKSTNTESLTAELSRSFADIEADNHLFILPSLSKLAVFLRRASALAQSLPNQAVNNFQTDFSEAIKDLPSNLCGTQVERMVKQRIGQDHFRHAMLDYWGNACSVTGITVTEVLRASHAKPWADCATDAERLDVFNGFLLCANLDALFDRFLISFDNNGVLLISSAIKSEQRERLSLHKPLSLRWVSNNHAKYLNYHRQRFLEMR